MVSTIFCSYTYLRKRSYLTSIFQKGWNHQLDRLQCLLFYCALPLLGAFVFKHVHLGSKIHASLRILDPPMEGFEPAFRRGRVPKTTPVLRVQWSLGMRTFFPIGVLHPFFATPHVVRRPWSLSTLLWANLRGGTTTRSGIKYLHVYCLFGIHGTGIYLPTFTIQNQPNVGRYTNMDPMGCNMTEQSWVFIHTGKATKGKVQDIGEVNKVMPLPLPSSVG